MIRKLLIAALGASACLPTCVTQDVPTFQAETQSAIVWGTQLPLGAKATIGQDPLSGALIKRLSFQGLEVSSTNGISERRTLAWGPPYSMTVWLTVINNTDQTLNVGDFTSTARVINPKKLKKARIRCYDNSPYPTGTIAAGHGQRFAAVLELMEPATPASLRYSVRIGGHDWVFRWNPNPGPSEDRISIATGCNLVAHE